MRLAALELAGFRGFAKAQPFDLDADAIVVVGANGHGKTSLMDGVLWALTGRIPRLSNGNGNCVVSLFSESGDATAKLTLRDPLSHKSVVITRSVDASGSNSRLSIEIDGQAYSGPTAEGRIVEMICPTALTAPDPNGSAASVITNSLYLQQDYIRHFVEAASLEERFMAVSELIGAGRVNELQGALERGKKAWTTATNAREQEMRPLRDRLNIIDGRLGELSKTPSPKADVFTAESWEQWWREAASNGVAFPYPEPSSRDAPGAIDSALKQLDAARRALERKLEAIRSVLSDARSLAQLPLPLLETLREKSTTASKKVDELKAAIQKEQSRLADERRAQVQLLEAQQQLQALATLALRHLSENCPVCTQKYDREATRKRLEQLARGGGTDISTAKSDVLTPLLSTLAVAEKEQSVAQLELRTAEQTLQRRQILDESIYGRMKALELSIDRDGRVGEQLEKHIGQLLASIQQLSDLQRRGEGVALALVQASSSVIIDELKREAQILRNDYTARIRDIASRNLTGESAQRLIEALREAALKVVDKRLREINPVLQSTYSRIDPHPAFRIVRFLSSVVRGKGQLSTIVSDPIAAKQSDIPAAVLSSSQVNALAVSIFLALNIGVPHAALPIAMLDDPMQSMDDIHLLALVDMLRRLKGRRQLFVATHDLRFGELLSRKLRPTNESERTRVVQLEGWTRQGPTVAERDIKRDPAPLRLVANR